MKKLATTLTALVMATGLTMTAQAATKATSTTKTTTAPAKNAKESNVKVEKTTKTNAKTTKKASAAAKTSAKANHAATKTGKKTGEVNIDIPAELKIDESNNKTAATSTNSGNVQPANSAVVLPVTQVTQTGPAVQSTSVQPINKNTAITSTTTTIPVDVQTVPVVVNP